MAETGKPFAYSVLSGYDETRQLRVLPTLADLVRVGELDPTLGPSAVSVQAWFAGETKDSSCHEKWVEWDIYSKDLVKQPSRDEALANIEKVRISLETKVKELAPRVDEHSSNLYVESVPKWYELGAPLEKQIAEFIKASEVTTRIWLSAEEIEANVKNLGWA